MSLVIHKFSIDSIGDEVWVEMPIHARILRVGCQRGILCIWAMVQRDQCIVTKRRFSIRGTGHTLAGVLSDSYLGTVIMDNGLVWHVFDHGESF